jgi:phosphonate transport system substrate-binding protein
MKTVASMALLIIGMTGFPLAGTAGEAQQRATFNIGFSPNLFTDVKKADALASMKVWTGTLLTRRNINLISVPVIYTDTDALKTALVAGKVDFVAMLTEEFFALEADIALDHFFYTSLHGSITEEYLLLVRRDHGVESLAALQGKRLALVTGARLGLASVWAETRLMQQGFSGLNDFFVSVDAQPKTSRAVLKVFFGKTDACLVSRAGFETMVELNPQIGKTLTVLEMSPAFIPALMCIRGSFDSALKEELVAGVLELDTDPRGQQMLTVFKADDLVQGGIEELASAREWIDTHTLLRSRLEQAKTQESGLLK